MKQTSQLAPAIIDSGVGVAAMLDLDASMGHVPPISQGKAAALWMLLSSRGKVAVLELHFQRFGTYDPSLGKDVCMCCGAPRRVH